MGAAPAHAIPAHALRLFPGVDESGPDPIDPASPQVIARLLEDGDARDLAWLTAEVPEERLAAWLDRHGARQLSRRSRAFWEAVLGRPAAAEPAGRRDLWPL
jgi:FAD/FMN-containing dehydrogenase